MGDKYSVKDMMGGRLCPSCNGEMSLVWDAAGKKLECTRCSKVQTSSSWTPPEKPSSGSQKR